jgi:squalene cyclase
MVQAAVPALAGAQLRDQKRCRQWLPWNTTVAVEWVDRATPADGSDYVNEGVHIIKMKWGKVVYLHAYLDTQLTQALCERLAAKGIEEAHAAPIED